MQRLQPLLAFGCAVFRRLIAHFLFGFFGVAAGVFIAAFAGFAVEFEGFGVVPCPSRCMDL